MSTTLRRQTVFSTLAAVFALTLCAPIVHADEVIAAEEPLLAAVPATPSWDETSGYGSVEASRAAIGHEEMVSGYSATGHEASAAVGLSWDAKSGYGFVETSRAEISALIAPAAAPTWDETSGYRSVEASRATIGHPAASTTQVPSDVRWAPTLASAPMAPVETSHRTNTDYIPAALASGQRAESACLATGLLPGEDAVEVRRTQR